MRPKYEIAFNALIKELNEIIADNELTIKEILPDQRFIEALHYQVTNSAIEDVIIRIENTLNELTELTETNKQ
jgi:hypothetical protein